MLSFLAEVLFFFHSTVVGILAGLLVKSVVAPGFPHGAVDSILYIALCVSCSIPGSIPFLTSTLLLLMVF